MIIVLVPANTLALLAAFLLLAARRSSRKTGIPSGDVGFPPLSNDVLTGKKPPLVQQIRKKAPAKEANASLLTTYL